MHIVSILLIALGLAMDAFAVSIANGLTVRDIKGKEALRIAAFFGGFQALMPLVGWWAGRGFRDLVSGIDHWLAFFLLGFIGLKMIYESFRMGSCEDEGGKALTYRTLVVLAVATSIDAFAVGISFAFLAISILTPVIVIGIVTFVLSLLGVFIGKKCGHFFEKKIEIAGGLILIGIGTKILLEHLF